MIVLLNWLLWLGFVNCVCVRSTTNTKEKYEKTQQGNLLGQSWPILHWKEPRARHAHQDNIASLWRRRRGHRSPASCRWSDHAGPDHGQPVLHRSPQHRPILWGFSCFPPHILTHLTLRIFPQLSHCKWSVQQRRKLDKSRRPTLPQPTCVITCLDRATFDNNALMKTNFRTFAP